MQDRITESMVKSVTDEIAKVVRSTLAGMVEREVSKALNKALNESELHRFINVDIRDGLTSIYREIATARRGDGSDVSPELLGQGGQLLTDASGELDSVINATEEASLRIMDLVESLQDKADQAMRDLEGDSVDPAAARAGVAGMSHDLMEILTALSFQDLTGQRIRHAIDALRRIENIVTELYVSSGLMIKEHENDPDKDAREIISESKQKVNQDGVDDLLSQFGL